MRHRAAGYNTPVPPAVCGSQPLTSVSKTQPTAGASQLAFTRIVHQGDGEPSLNSSSATQNARSRQAAPTDLDSRRPQTASPRASLPGCRITGSHERHSDPAVGSARDGGRDAPPRWVISASASASPRPRCREDTLHLPIPSAILVPSSPRGSPREPWRPTSGRASPPPSPRRHQCVSTPHRPPSRREAEHPTHLPSYCSSAGSGSKSSAPTVGGKSAPTVTARDPCFAGLRISLPSPKAERSQTSSPRRPPTAPARTLKQPLASSFFDGADGCCFSPERSRRSHLAETDEVQLLLADADRAAIVRKVKWFRELTDDDMETLLERASVRFFPRYSLIFREGSHGATFYVLLRGCVRSTSALHGTTMLQPGAAFGETGLAPGLLREATAQALTPVHALQLVRDDLNALRSRPELDEIRRLVIRRGLESVSFFCDLSNEHHTELTQIVQVHYAKAGEAVFYEGDPGNALFVLIEGRAAAFKEALGPGPLAEYHPKAERPWFGELALLSKSSRSATVRALETCKLFEIHRADFSRFLTTCPTFLEIVTRSHRAYRSINLVRERTTLTNRHAQMARRALSEDSRSAQHVYARWERVMIKLLATTSDEALEAEASEAVRRARQKLEVQRNKRLEVRRKARKVCQQHDFCG